MPSTIQIKRSTAAADPGTTLTLAELAYSYNSNTLFIGAANGVGDPNVAIGGSGYVRSLRLDQFAAPTAAVALNSQKITNLGTPTVATDAATKAYVDSLQITTVDGGSF